MLTSIPQLYEQFQRKLPHSNDLEKDQELYTFNARHFLISITADALYYGRFISDTNDSFIDEAFKPGNKRKAKPGKKKASKTKSRDLQPSKSQTKSRDLQPSKAQIKSRDLLQSHDQNLSQ